MAAETTGGNGHINQCGVATFHAFSLITAFEMTEMIEETKTLLVHDMIMMRNPWGNTGYRGDWNENDSRWTDELVA